MRFLVAADRCGGVYTSPCLTFDEPARGIVRFCLGNRRELAARIHISSGVINAREGEEINLDVKNHDIAACRIPEHGPVLVVRRSK